MPIQYRPLLVPKQAHGDLGLGIVALQLQWYRSLSWLLAVMPKPIQSTSPHFEVSEWMIGCFSTMC